MNGIGADIMIIIQCLLYCRMNNINFFMNKNDDWKIAKGNWKKLFVSLDLSEDPMDEVDDDFLKKVYDTPMNFEQLSEVANEIFVPQKKISKRNKFFK